MLKFVIIRLQENNCDQHPASKVLSLQEVKREKSSLSSSDKETYIL